MAALQRLCSGLAGRLRLGGHSQAAALQAASRHLATFGGGGDSSGSSSDEEEQGAHTGAAYEHAARGDDDYGSGEEEEPDFEPDKQVEGGPAYEVPGGEADGAFMLSAELTELWEEVQRIDPAALVEQIEQEEAESEKPPPGVKPGDDDDEPGPEDATPEDYRLLLEAIQLYFTAAPVMDEELDGMNEEDREILAMIGGVLQEELEGPPTQTVNIAPPGRLPWEVIAADEEAGVVHWGVDFTEGRAVEPWRNALLSGEAKQLMWDLHKEDPEVFSVENLAKEFKVRQQRVMAILALKQMEEDARAKGVKLDDELEEIMETEVHGCDEAVGSGERHYAILPSYPNYQELEPSEVVSRLEAKLGKPIDQISEDDLTPELAREVLGVVSKEEVEEEIAMREERELVEDFRRNLEYNLGKVGQGIKRASRKSHAPRRPREGWSLVVTPLGGSSNPQQQAKEAYVAQPDGSRRPLTEDELLNLKRSAAIPRRKTL